MRAFILFLLFAFCLNSLLAKELTGKEIFYSVKGKFGSCNTCHPGGASAGRWDFENNEISSEDGKKIPSLKGIGKKKSPEQVERSVKLMIKWFSFKLADEEITKLAEYIVTL
jgi:cytochrome c peroxidase